MLKQMNAVRKNKLLLPAAVVALLLCWFLAFGKTYEAIKINHELSGQIPTEEDIAFNPIHTERKLAALAQILKSYQVNETEWSNQLWMKASAVAMKQHIGIDYALTRPEAERNSTQLGLTETLTCYGDYRQLVRLIDTLEKMPQIGKISALQVKAPKEEATGERARQCILKIAFKGFNK